MKDNLEMAEELQLKSLISDNPTYIQDEKELASFNKLKDGGIAVPGWFTWPVLLRLTETDHVPRTSSPLDPFNQANYAQIG